MNSDFDRQALSALWSFDWCQRDRNLYGGDSIPERPDETAEEESA